MIDELPLVGLLGALASGTTVVRGAAELRVKESDRIASVVRALRALGVDAEEREDGFAVTRRRRRSRGGAMESVGDHRLAMLGAVAGLVSREGVAVGGFEAVARVLPRLRPRPRRRSGACPRDRRHRRARRAPARAPSRAAVARRLGVAYLDTGAMYRALTWLAREHGVAPSDDEAGLAALARANPIEIEPTDDGDRVRVAGTDVTAAIRAPEVAAAGLGGVRPPGRARRGRRAPSAPSCRRARGSPTGATSARVVCPDADLKVFLTASLQERARRRRADLRARGVEMDDERVLEDVRRRDHVDSTRSASPLRVAEGAVVIDSSEHGHRRRSPTWSCSLVEDVRARRESAARMTSTSTSRAHRHARLVGRRAHPARAAGPLGPAPAGDRPGAHPRRRARCSS